MRRPSSRPTAPRAALGTTGLLLALSASAYFPSQPRQGSDCDGPAQRLQNQARQEFDQAQQLARQRDAQRPPPNCFSNPSCAMQWNQQQQRYGQMISQYQQRAQGLQNEANQGLFQCRQQLAQFERQRQFEQAQQLQMQQQAQMQQQRALAEQQRLMAEQQRQQQMLQLQQQRLQQEQQQADFERKQRRVTEAVTAITRLATGEMSVGDAAAQLAERQARKKLGHEGTELVKSLGSGLVTQLRDGGSRVGGDAPFVPEAPSAPPPPPPPPPPARVVAQAPPSGLAPPGVVVPADSLSAPAPRAEPLLAEGLREVDGFGPLPEPLPPDPAPAPAPATRAAPPPTEAPTPRRGPGGGPPPVARTPAITRLVACLGLPVAERQQCLPEVCKDDDLRFEPRCAVFR